MTAAVYVTSQVGAELGWVGALVWMASFGGIVVWMFITIRKFTQLYLQIHGVDLWPRGYPYESWWMISKVARDRRILSQRQQDPELEKLRHRINFIYILGAAYAVLGPIFFTLVFSYIGN